MHAAAFHPRQGILLRAICLETFNSMELDDYKITKNHLYVLSRPQPHPRLCLHRGIR